MHRRVKERANSAKHNPHFIVYMKTMLNGRAVETQKRFSFKYAKDRATALELANSKAAHVEKRHYQLRQARANRVSLIGKFFHPNGKVKGLRLSCRVRNGYPAVDLVAQKSVNGTQLNKSRTLLGNEPFDRVFNEVFSWFCGAVGVGVNNAHVQVFKAVVRRDIAIQYRLLKM